MAKTAAKSRAGVRRAGKAKRMSKGSKASVRAHTLNVHEENHIDGCDVEFLESEATPDAELPAAMGGVEIIRGKRRRTTATPGKQKRTRQRR